MSDNIQISRVPRGGRKTTTNRPNSRKNKKKGGDPYSVQARKLRRDEVFKLYCDYGYKKNLRCLFFMYSITFPK